MKADLFQTLEARGNHQDLVAKAPYLCDRKDAWLTEGYYFWEAYIDLAHAWGESAHRGKYVILSTTLHCNPSKVLNLNDPNQLTLFESYTRELGKKYPIDNVQQVLRYMMEMHRFPYQAISTRAERSFDVRKHHRLRNSLKFSSKYKAYLDLRPQIQWCVIDKALLDGCQYEVAYDTRQYDISPMSI